MRYVFKVVMGVEMRMEERFERAGTVARLILPTAIGTDAISMECMEARKEAQEMEGHMDSSSGMVVGLYVSSGLRSSASKKQKRCLISFVEVYDHVMYLSHQSSS